MSQQRVEKRRRPIPLPRQKACNSCSQAKVRCDHKPRCTRCEVRNLQCIYPSGRQKTTDLRDDLLPSEPTQVDHTQHPASGSPALGSNEDFRLLEQLNHDAGVYTTPVSAFEYPVPRSINKEAWTGDSNLASHETLLPRSGADVLACSIDATAIQNRWLNAFIPEADQKPKIAPPVVNLYVARMLKAYTGTVVHNSADSLPPFVHGKQPDLMSTDSPLLKCFTLSRLCGKGNDTMARELLEAEMLKFFETRSSLDGNRLLCAFQAYLIYVMILYFQLSQHDTAVLQQHIINLQQLACDACSAGTVTAAELDHSRPQWNSWIIVESKRRTLYTMYLFDNLLCVKDNMPVFIATELRSLPAPAGRQLWRASSEELWRSAYNGHLAEWDDSGLRLDELWKAVDMGPDELQRRSNRIDRWLEQADEYCVMLYAVTSGTHGG